MLWKYIFLTPYLSLNSTNFEHSSAVIATALIIDLVPGFLAIPPKFSSSIAHPPLIN